MARWSWSGLDVADAFADGRSALGSPGEFAEPDAAGGQVIADGTLGH